MSRDIQVNFRPFQAYALSGEAAGSEREEKVAFFRELLSGQRGSERKDIFRILSQKMDKTIKIIPSVQWCQNHVYHLIT